VIDLEDLMKQLSRLFGLTPGATLNPARGVRTTLASFLALLLLADFGHTANGRAVGLGVLLGVLFTSFCDLGQVPRARLRAMSALSLGGPLFVALGRSLASPWWQAVLGVFLVTLLSGPLRVFGPLISLVGLLLAILFVLSLGIGGGFGTALPAALGFLLGGALVLLLTLPSSLLEHVRHPAPPPEQSALMPPLSFVSLRVYYDRRSPLFWQGLFRALGAGGAAALTWTLGVAYPQWAPIIVILCIRPDKEASIQAVWHNFLGTVLGALLAELFLTRVQNPLAALLILVVVVFLAFTVKDVNYAFFVFFKTNLTLLFISLATPGVSRARLLVFSVLVGGSIALALTYLSAWMARRQGSHSTAAS
jgi:hypothetical protein